MAELQKYQAKICFTACGALIYKGKALLVKHKKLGLWLAPGGHMEEGEFPHQAAEREFWEEAGIKVRAVDITKPMPSNDSEYLPNPILTNLHWVSEKNYQKRLASKHPENRVKTALWKRGCEQHLCFVYMLEPVAGVKEKMDPSESDDIGWFTQKEIQELKTTEDIKNQFDLAFQLAKT